MIQPLNIIGFWRDAGPGAWFKKNPAFDEKCRAFEPAHHAAARGEYASWEQTAEGALALCLLLDQIPRNIFRGSAHAFATDPLALAIARRALNAGFDKTIDMPLRIFFYLPLEHAEDAGAQAQSMALFQATGIDEYVRFAAMHRDIIARFGRFPHRNAALARVTTAEEAEFLKSGGFAG